MKQISALVAAFSQGDIAQIEREDRWTAEIDGVRIEAAAADFDIVSERHAGVAGRYGWQADRRARHYRDGGAASRRYRPGAGQPDPESP
ncbi:MAG: hypothetical protein ACLR8Y_15215 [Alistipes indistinctus]